MDNILIKSHKKLEIQQILDKLFNLCVLPETKRMAEDIKPSNDIDELNVELDKVDECYRIICRFERAPIMLDSEFRNIMNLALKGSKLTAIEIYEVAKLFNTVKANNKLLNSLISEKIECNNYQKWVSELEVIDYLDNIILKSINENGEVLDSASSKLKQIRTKLNGIDMRIKSKCQEIMAKEIDKL